MAIEIVDLPIKNGDFPVRYVSLPEGNWCHNHQCQRGTQTTNITRHLPHFLSGNSTACFSCKCHGWLHHKGHKVHKLFENKNTQSLKQLCVWKCGRHLQMANSKKGKMMMYIYIYTILIYIHHFMYRWTIKFGVPMNLGSCLKLCLKKKNNMWSPRLC